MKDTKRHRETATKRSTWRETNSQTSDTPMPDRPCPRTAFCVKWYANDDEDESKMSAEIGMRSLRDDNRVDSNGMIAIKFVNARIMFNRTILVVSIRLPSLSAALQTSDQLAGCLGKKCKFGFPRTRNWPILAWVPRCNNACTPSKQTENQSVNGSDRVGQYVANDSPQLKMASGMSTNTRVHPQFGCLVACLDGAPA